jgi:hypothetical protein
MTHWPAAKAQRVLAALLRIGWTLKRQSGSHRTLQRAWQAGILFSRSMTAMKSARACLRVSPNRQAWVRTTYRVEQAGDVGLTSLNAKSG